MDNIKISNKPCFMEMQQMIESRKDEFTETQVDDQTRSFTRFPFINKVRYYECLEDSIKKVIDKYTDIQVEDIFKDNYEISFLQDLCFFVKEILSSIQGLEIIWYIDDDQKGIRLDKVENGIIDAITTGKDINYQVILDVFV